MVKQVQSGGTALNLTHGFNLRTPGNLSPLRKVIEEKFYLLTGLKNATSQGWPGLRFGRWQNVYLIVDTPSLTTGKPLEASNNHRIAKTETHYLRLNLI